MINSERYKTHGVSLRLFGKRAKESSVETVTWKTKIIGFFRNYKEHRKDDVTISREIKKEPYAKLIGKFVGEEKTALRSFWSLCISHKEISEHERQLREQGPHEKKEQSTPSVPIWKTCKKGIYKG